MFVGEGYGGGGPVEEPSHRYLDSSLRGQLSPFPQSHHARKLKEEGHGCSGPYPVSQWDQWGKLKERTQESMELKHCSHAAGTVSSRNLIL